MFKFSTISLFKLCFLLTIYPLLVISQTTYWAKLIESPSSEVTHSILLLPNNDFLLTGWTNNISQETENLLLIYCDKDGNIVWQKSLGGPLLEVGLCAINTSDNNILVAGIAQSFGQGSSDIWLIKINRNGKILWQKTYGGFDDESVTQVIQTEDGGFIVAGWTYSFGNGSHDALIFKIDSTGNLLWQKCYGTPASEDIRCFTQAKNGNMLITGITNDSLYGTVMWIASIDSIGNILKQVKFFDTNIFHLTTDLTNSITGYVFPTDIYQFGDNYLIAGVTLSYFSSDKSPFVLVINDSLELVSASTYDFSGYISHSTIYKDKIYLSGFAFKENSTYTDVLIGAIRLPDFTFSGRLFGGNESESGYVPMIIDDTTLLVAGYSYSFSNGNSDILLLKISDQFSLPDGEVKIAKSFQNIPPFDIIRKIDVLPLDFRIKLPELIVSTTDANVIDINMNVRDLNRITSVQDSETISIFSTSEEIVILLPEHIHQASDISIQNILGQEVIRIPRECLFNKNHFKLNLKELPNGVYFVTSNSKCFLPFVKVQ